MHSLKNCSRCHLHLLFIAFYTVQTYKQTYTAEARHVALFFDFLPFQLSLFALILCIMYVLWADKTKQKLRKNSSRRNILLLLLDDV